MSLSTQIAESGKLVLLPTAEIHPHPRNPRKDLGDISELAESIKAKGILQNLTVVRGHWMTQAEYAQLAAQYRENPTEEGRELLNRKWLTDGYTVIIGHRRLAASKLAGVETVPCVIVDMTDREQFETMVIENVQRSDLTVYEQAESFQMMLDMGGTIESVSEQTGFSESTIRTRLKLTKLDRKKFADSIERGATLQDYAKLDEIKDDKTRNKVLESIGTPNFNSELQSAINKQKMQENIDRWISFVSPFATEVEKQDTKTTEYVKGFNRYNDPENYTPPEDCESVKYFYRVEKGYGVYLYKEKPAEDDPEKIRAVAERQAKEQAFNQRKAELEEMRDLHNDLRTQFVMEFGAAKKCSDAIMMAGLRAIVRLSGDYRPGIDWLMVADMLDISMDDEQEKVDPVEYAAVIKEKPAYALLVTTYAALAKENDCYYDWHWNGTDKVFCHKECERLDIVYMMLTNFGYEMSDEEKAMKDGTHPLICAEPDEDYLDDEDLEQYAEEGFTDEVETEN